jgi:hypothetical protein
MHLAAQFGAAAMLILLTTLIHAIGVVAIAHWLKLDRERQRVRRLHPRTVALLSAVALLLFAIHSLEIALFALFYAAVGAVPDLDQALYFSAAAYSTIGTADVSLPAEWRLVGATEGVVGFLMLGWSAAFFVTDMNKLLRS